MKKTYNIGFEAFSYWENASFEKNIPLRRLLKPDGGEMEIVTLRKVKELYPSRKVNGHKGTYGRCVIIAGSDNYPGAALLATASALRSGVGILSLMSVKEVTERVNIAYHEAVATTLCSNDGHIAYCESNLKAISSELEKADSLLFGCGVGQSEDTGKLLEFVLENASCPVIIDADGINLLAKRIDCLRNAKADILLTPHVGELARLCGVSTAEAIANRCELAKALTEQFGITVAAKSASSVISAKDGIYLTLWGNDGLARGGSGDTLAGLCSSFAAQGLNVGDAAILSSSVLGLGCELLTKKYATRGILPSDIARILPMLFKKIERLD